MNTHLIIGDILRRPKSALTEHTGVWAGNGLVFHNAPGKGECLESYAAFANGQPVTFERSGISPYIAWARIQERLLRLSAYDLIANNCEHAATRVARGVASSPQLQGFILISFLVGMLIAAAREG
jgi:hypothetical protein